MENTTEVKHENLKVKAFGFLDWLIGGLLLGLFLGIVVVMANFTINLFNRWFPKTKKETN